MMTNRFENSAPAERIYSSCGESFGVKTGGSHFCQLGGCGGQRIGVRWPDGKITYPCSKGLVPHSTGAEQIG